ncbi:MAG: hypothetical protein GF330_03335 [Candidatus Eisenbacteria bacterium]|nr:hypothetical protein [Candidatus Eisenbacteria bacterium]
MGEQRLDLGDPPAPAIGRHSCHPRLVVGGIDVDAHIYVTWMDDRNSTVAGSGYDIYGNHSLDGGTTWQLSDYRIDIGDQPGRNDSWYPHPGWAAGPYFLWRDVRNGQGDVYTNLFSIGPDEGDIFYVESFDGGQTWSHPPLRVNDDPIGNFLDQSHPWLDFKPDGTVDVVWYDNRNDPANDLQMETFFAVLHPGAGAFSANTPIAPPMPPVTTWNWTGDYIWVDTDAATAHVALTGSGTDPTHGDVFYTAVENPEPPPQPGACCTPGRGCEFVTEDECLALGGEFLGEGVPCDPDPCTDAVCCLDWDCTVVTAAECRDLGGIWHAERDDCDPNPCGARYADHDVGNCLLTVTAQGIVGFTDGTQAEGSGFVYPRARQGENHLFLGGLWVGLDSAYVANRDYDDDPDREWQTSVDPDGHLWIDCEGIPDQSMWAAYTDSAAAEPRGLLVEQESWAFAREGNQAMDDFVILHYTVTNRTALLEEDVYVGVFLDFDIADYTRNLGWADSSRNLVAMHDANEPPDIHVGLRLLQDDLGGPPLSNASLIDNQTFVYPQAHMLDADKYGFLSAAGPQYTLLDTTGFGAADYSVVTAAGPFDLGPGDTQAVSFAIIGGESREAFLQNATVAQRTYEQGPSATREPEAVPDAVRLLAARPNPFTAATVIRLILPRRSEVDLGVYDIAGRRLRSLLDGRRPGGVHDLRWDGRDSRGRRVQSGVYFLRLRSDLSNHDCRLVVIR